MKVCGSCRRELPEDMFCRNRSKSDGMSDSCRECKSQQDREYRDKNKDKLKKQAHEYYVKHKEETIARTTEYIRQHRNQHNAWSTKARNKLKATVFQHYCDEEIRCTRCGVDDIEVLSIDHVAGNGSEHRRELFGCGGGYKFYQWIKRNDYPNGFQVLCFNCQFRKRLTEMRPECPTHIQEVRAKYVRSVKLECLERYGGLQCTCGERDPDVLTLDHVNDDGAKHRRETGTRGFNFYIMLRKIGFPNDPPLQVMCLNCQIKKRQRKYEEGKIRSGNDGNGAALVV